VRTGGAPLIPGVRMVVVGRQGAGTGTQCVRLSRHYVVPHISTGDMLRAAVKEGTELGRRADSIMNAGGLVPDDVMIGIVQERLGHADALTRGYLLDGFPRTVAQAEAMEEITAHQLLDLAIDLDVPREMVLERLSSRRVCRDCGTNYTATGTERKPWICDVCSGDVIHREDDTEEAINRRLDGYETQTRPLIDFYASRHRLVTVSGVGTPDAVLVRLIAAIESRRRSPVVG
jgi:adenylate kinase